ncbi:2-succinyl-5-enolpyruvyl-6-hydroxy-3-cyclohexene-1-carboxylic-acid synthase [Synechococcus sp. CBW1107]|uniref:2-succinyl-5-enolpyruvyl-6-hydroxy-3- cyclohexene-1-carboxylic-acid synthase n=1 Tax=Synechococcus sp. CBW1107 TaxID=2789857 RepID=UPI002AD54CE2|nr:2-succinyl-5-enolpyruvyl-6-hydroxy-3-cyclohexene-1-carboxylic-acid synthase [Synechococcus sp. CBW1107]CAK6695786.1 2-succinyl-5-enolpyruvyl-6-hydroxy-3-cyclohexene-1-carboxylate synthase [Synechococcus sp. CBW1107]
MAAAAQRNLQAALTLLAELQSAGLQHLVLCPGSRSGPLAVAAGLQQQRGLRLHTAIDERSAAFFALGLGRAEGRAAAVVTTSGTAVANLLPAVVEADYGAIPLLLLTADRPVALKGCGANQTVNQQDFLRANCRWYGEGPPEGLADASETSLRNLAWQAMAATAGSPAPSGPVHLNLPFSEPLHGNATDLLALAAASLPETPNRASSELLDPSVAHPFNPQPPDQPVGQRAEPLGQPAQPAATHSSPLAGSPGDAPHLDPDLPGVVVAGPWRGPMAAFPAFLEALRQWQRRSGWPVLADALSSLRGCPGLELICSYDLLLCHPDLLLGPTDLASPQGQPLQVLRLGPLPASRRLQQWLGTGHQRQVLISEAEPRPLDPLGTGALQWDGGLVSWLASAPPAWRSGSPAPDCLALGRQWHQAQQAMQTWLDQKLQPDPSAGLNEPGLARWLSQRLPADLPLLLANSSPVRDWESFGSSCAPHRPVFSFRGASGIDGTLSLACGIAEALGAAVLVCGDLALLHDCNGWLWQQQLRGRLTVLLIDNGGGGIFEQLSIRPSDEALLDFERLFAMPQAVDPCALAAAHGVPARSINSWSTLEETLAWALQLPMALVRLRTDRRADASRRQHLRTMAAARPDPS